jgi:hypothetical protein
MTRKRVGAAQNAAMLEAIVNSVQDGITICSD